MKKLLNICVIIWVFLVFGRSVLPSIFENYYTFWSIHIILAAILPIGFAKSLISYFQIENQSIKSTKYVASFLSVFLMVVGLQVVNYYNLTALKMVTNIPHLMLSIKETSECENEENRLFEAGFLFGEYGIKIPYRLDSGEYKIYEPTKEEIVEYNAKLKRSKENIEIGQKISRVAITSSKVVILYFLSFFVLFLATIIYEQRFEIKRK